MSEISIKPIYELRGEICRDILRELPDWFGIPESVDAYVAFADQADMLGAVSEGAVCGFVTLRNTSAAACEMYLMGVRPTFHRRRIGTALVGAARNWARAAGRRYLTVKTVGPSRANAAYEGTRRFYLAAGFEPIEEFEGLWSENPCLLMLRTV